MRLTLFSFLLFSWFNFLSAQCDRERDSLALVALYDSTDGSNWTRVWDLNQPMETWYGIDLNSDGCVSCIDMDGVFFCEFNTVGTQNGNNLNGPLPDELAQLSDLIILDLYNNNITGNIPTWLDTFSKLQFLHLGPTGLTGEIPVELGNISSLIELHIGGWNTMSGGIPKELGNLNLLQKFTLSGTGFSGSIPSELSQLKQLTNLTIHQTSIGGEIPAELGGLDNLEVLRLHINDFSGSIPSELALLLKLKDLLLSHNNLTGVIPSEIGSINTLERFLANDNNLSGCFHDDLIPICDFGFGNFGYDFTNNPLLPWQGDFEHFCTGDPQIGAPCDDGKSYTENDVIQSDCSCSGTIVCDRQSDSLELVRFYNATGGPTDWFNKWDLFQPMDTWWGVSFDSDGCVERLNLNENNLTGFLPDIILPQLKGLSCHENNIGDEIPDFSGLPQLQWFSCRDNKLSGVIPDFSNLPMLENFHCSSNNLSGNIPNFTSLTNLEQFSCGYNAGSNFSGSLPDFSNSPKLRYLDCSGSNLTGNIPDFSNLKNLDAFYCYNNNLEGIIPDFSNTRKLKYFYCYGNNLEGNVPNLADNCPNLARFYFNQNQFTFENILPSISANETRITQNASFSKDSLIYSPQNKIFIDTTIRFHQGENINIDLAIDDTVSTNIYTWFKNGDTLRTIHGDNKLTISNIQYSDVGTYWVHVTNPNVSELTLESHEIKVIVSPPCDPARDSLALTDLYKDTRGWEWSKYQWDTLAPMSDRPGVYLNAEGCVQTLDLDGVDDGTFQISPGGNNLNGVLPQTLGDLKNLKNIYLTDNFLIGGAIPDSITTIPHLKEIYFDNCSLKGTIPGELADLDSLTAVILDFNYFTFENLLHVVPFLETISYDYAPQAQIYPDSVFTRSVGQNFTISLNIDDTVKTSIYTWFKNDILYKTETTNEFSINSLDFLDAGVYRVEVTNPNAPDLTLMSGEIELIVNSSCRQNDSLALVDFYFATGGNDWRVKWELTEPMDQWHGIRLNNEGCVICIDLDGNDNCDIDALTGNNLSGFLSPSIGRLENLRLFSLKGNQISGSIPDEIGDLNSLEYLSLYGNSFSDTLPASIENLTGLKWLSLAFNNLSGGLPILANYDSLFFLSLHNNSFEGELPANWGSLPDLRNILVHKNNLSGTLPDEWGTLVDLERLYLNDNQLEGCFPSSYRNAHCDLSFSQNSDLRGFNFSNNSKLPWQGDFTGYCNNNQQTGATCDDQNPNTENDQIQADCSCSGTLTCRAKDSIVLIDFYRATGGDNWLTKTNWLQPGQPIDTWHGVTLDANGCVKNLILDNNRLTGELPDFNLPNLERFECYNNELTGNIPDYTSLPRLTHLFCYINNLSGNIPDFSGLPSLQSLLCYENNLEGNIPNFSNTPELRNLLCHKNLLNGIIPDFNNLPKLSDFRCYDNMITDTIPDFSNTPELNIFYCYKNSLEGKIPDFSNTPMLQDFICNDNNLEGKIPDFSNLPALNQFICSQNRLTGCFPAFICNLNSFDALQNIDLPWEGNHIPFCDFGTTQIGATCNDGNSDTQNDQIQPDCSCAGTTINPCEISNRAALEAFYVATGGSNWLVDSNWLDPIKPLNQWHGIVTNADGCVTQIVLPKNNLTGDFPDINISTLDTINVDNNNLTGSIPDFNLLNLTYLDCGQNMLKDSIPQFSNAPILRFVDCDGNQLTGEIPDFNSTSFQVLDCDNNLLSGEIPDFRNTPNLRYLNCSDNRLEGDIPNFPNGQNLRFLYCSNNNLTGIPNFSNLPILLELTADSNQIGGSIPDFNLPELEILYLHENVLDDSIPNFTKMPNLQEFSAFANQLTGVIPPFSQTPEIRSINICQNRLTGEIPDLSMLSNLESFVCCSNDLSGCYPNFICGLDLFDATANPKLPWEGDHTPFCDLGDTQIGANCDDDDPMTENDEIRSDCSCIGCPTDILRDDQTVQICPGDSYDWNGRILTVPGNYTDTIRNAFGCNIEIIGLQLDIFQKTIAPAENATFCEGSNFVWRGKTYDSEGIFFDTLSHPTLSCDSVIFQLNLEMNNRFEDNSTEQLCEGDTLRWNGQVITGAGDFEFLSQTTQGCDSLLNLKVNLLPSSKDSITQSICEGDTISWNGQIITEEGIFEYRSQTVQGCDSLIELKVMQLLTPSVAFNEILCEGDTIFWNGQVITAADEYQGILSATIGCDTTATLIVDLQDTQEIETEDDFYPFPTEGNELIFFPTDNDLTPVEFKLNLLTEPVLGALSVDETYRMVYTPRSSTVSGRDSFYYEICHKFCFEICDTALVVIEIEGDCLDQAEEAVDNINAITPNDDGLNDFFHPILEYVELGCNVSEDIAKLTVVNRWGTRVFSGPYPTGGWNGKSLNTDIALPQGAYYYLLEIDLPEETERIEGTINLITKN